MAMSTLISVVSPAKTPSTSMKPATAPLWISPVVSFSSSGAREIVGGVIAGSLSRHRRHQLVPRLPRLLCSPFRWPCSGPRRPLSAPTRVDFREVRGPGDSHATSPHDHYFHRSPSSPRIRSELSDHQTVPEWSSCALNETNALDDSPLLGSGRASPSFYRHPPSATVR